MDFATAWASLSIGDTVTISNGQPHPGSKPDSLSTRIWASHNFTGELVAKLAGERRSLCFNLPPNAAGNVVGYAIAEDSPHEFALAD